VPTARYGGSGRPLLNLIKSAARVRSDARSQFTALGHLLPHPTKGADVVPRLCQITREPVLLYRPLGVPGAEKSATYVTVVWVDEPAVHSSPAGQLAGPIAQRVARCRGDLLVVPFGSDARPAYMQIGRAAERGRLEPLQRVPVEGVGRGRLAGGRRLRVSSSGMARTAGTPTRRGRYGRRGRRGSAAQLDLERDNRSTWRRNGAFREEQRDQHEMERHTRDERHDAAAKAISATPHARSLYDGHSNTATLSVRLGAL
jgi:hypothetical protein